jgi:chemotaxis protein methyltransferase CheR
MLNHHASTPQLSSRLTHFPPPAHMQQMLTDAEFEQFSELLAQMSGILLPPGKKQLVMNRLSCRLRHFGLARFHDYFLLATRKGNEAEKRKLIDLLTTNETYFFREPAHFEFLRSVILPAYPAAYPFRLWSAAASSGEEAYSSAMLLAEHFNRRSAWTVSGTDINEGILERARSAKYPIEACKHIPERYLKPYCLKGIAQEQGNLLIKSDIRSHVHFDSFNLNSPTWGSVGLFDVILLRNVMIYFAAQTRDALINRIIGQLKPGGYLFVGHAESVNDPSGRLERIRPSIFRLRD